MTAVWQLKLNSTDKLVFLALADNASDEGICWPSVTTLSKKTCLSTRGVRASVARLQKYGHLKRIFRSGRSNNYLIEALHSDPIPRNNMPPTPAPRAAPPRHHIPPEPSSRTINEPSYNLEGFLKNIGGLKKFDYTPSLDACQKVRDITPGWDQNMLLSKYREWQKGRNVQVKHPDAAYVGWARKFTKGMPPR